MQFSSKKNTIQIDIFLNKWYSSDAQKTSKEQ